MSYSRISIMLTSLLVLTSALGSSAFAHCEIPCGIFHDDIQFARLDEHIETIEKSMVTIRELEQQTPVPYNQLVRWVVNKEDHADKIAKDVTDYFLRQRVIVPAADASPAERESYIRQLTSLHDLLVASTRAKQTIDTAVVNRLRGSLARFRRLYAMSRGGKAVVHGDSHSHHHHHCGTCDHDHSHGHGHSHRH